MIPWDGKTERRRNGDQSDHDLLNQIDTKMTILLNTFDKHVLEDKQYFNKHEDQLNRLEKVYGVAVACVVIFEIVMRFFK